MNRARRLTIEPIEQPLIEQEQPGRVLLEAGKQLRGVYDGLAEESEILLVGKLPQQRPKNPAPARCDSDRDCTPLASA